jgi:hypothetical protein
MKQKKNEINTTKNKEFKYTWRYLDRGCYENNILLSNGTIKNIKEDSKRRKNSK